MNHDDESAPTSVRMAWGAGWATTDDNGVDLDASFAWFGWGEGGDDGVEVVPSAKVISISTGKYPDPTR